MDRQWLQRRSALRFLRTLGHFVAIALGAGLAMLVITRVGLAMPVASSHLDSDDSLASVYRQASPGVVSLVEYGGPKKASPDQARGSGFVVDLGGHILTNHHVAEALLNPGVLLFDGNVYPAELVGQDSVHDLAVLKAKVPIGKLHPLTLGDSSTLQVGQQVVAIGTPFGLDQTLTSGVVSYLRRRVQRSDNVVIEGAIQTDTAIYLGNSGGPLLDRRGEVIGVNAAYLAGDGGIDHSALGVAFAIPSKAVKELLPRMISGDLQARPWLGVAVQDSRAAGVQGARIALVVPSGPADRAQLRGTRREDEKPDGTVGDSGDLITTIDGVAVRSASDLESYIGTSRLRVGDAVRLQVVRAGQALDVTVTLHSRVDWQADLLGAI